MRRTLVALWSNRSVIALCVAIAAAGSGIVLWGQAISRANDARDAAADVQCVTLSAVIDAGRGAVQKIMTSEGDSAYGETVAREYGLRVATVVEEHTGVSGLVRRDGTLDCAKLHQLARDSDAVLSGP
jgi:hypothetical protein